MSKVKRLLISAAGIAGEAQILPVNTGTPVYIESEIGEFAITVFIKDFDGCEKHQANSLKNFGDELLLNGSQAQKINQSIHSRDPNLRILINFTPKYDIPGTELIFGNDCPTPVRDYIPTTLLSTGIRFFSWFINPTITQDIYCDEPYLYGLALNSFTKLGMDIDDFDKFIENPEDSLDKSLNLPRKPQDRRNYFCKTANAHNFTFYSKKKYTLMFDTNFVSIGNSHYNVAIPTYRDKTFDIDVVRYANEKLDNFNWTVKQAPADQAGAKAGKFGFKLNFKLIEET